MRLISSAIFGMCFLQRHASLKCYALASRALFGSTSVRSTRAKKLATFARGGSKFDSKVSGSSTSLSALSVEEKSFASIAGTPVSGEFGGIPLSDSSNGYRVVFVLGGPGAGKGTQSDLMLEEYPCVHLSAGQLLRDETSKKDSPHAALIEECLVAGKIVPVEISLALLRNEMESSSSKSLIFLVDGFPRNYDNLKGWASCMQGVADVLGVLVYECPLSVLEERILERAKGSGRSDDNLESLRKRFKTFEGETMRIIDTLRLLQEHTNMNVWDIMGDQPLEKVWGETKDCMNALIANDVLVANRKLLEAVAKRRLDLYRNLCADEMFDGMSTEDVMAAQEGVGEFPEVCVVDAELNFISGKNISVTYKRVSKTSVFQETRVWAYKELSGWRNVHFSRFPC